MERLSIRGSLAALLALGIMGCAIAERENRRTLNALDAHATPIYFSGDLGARALFPIDRNDRLVP